MPSPILPVLRCAGLVVDTAQRSAWRAGRQLDLAPKEFGVLELLLSARGRAVPAEKLLERAWDGASAGLVARGPAIRHRARRARELEDLTACPPPEWPLPTFPGCGGVIPAATGKSAPVLGRVRPVTTVGRGPA